MMRAVRTCVLIYVGHGVLAEHLHVWDVATGIYGPSMLAIKSYSNVDLRIFVFSDRKKCSPQIHHAHQAAHHGPDSLCHGSVETYRDDGKFKFLGQERSLVVRTSSSRQLW